MRKTWMSEISVRRLGMAKKKLTLARTRHISSTHRSETGVEDEDIPPSHIRKGLGTPFLISVAHALGCSHRTLELSLGPRPHSGPEAIVWARGHILGQRPLSGPEATVWARGHLLGLRPHSGPEAIPIRIRIPIRDSPRSRTVQGIPQSRTALGTPSRTVRHTSIQEGKVCAGATKVQHNHGNSPVTNVMFMRHINRRVRRRRTCRKSP